jgi:hypothetical protein
METSILSFHDLILLFPSLFGGDDTHFLIVRSCCEKSSTAISTCFFRWEWHAGRTVAVLRRSGYRFEQATIQQILQGSSLNIFEISPFFKMALVVLPRTVWQVSNTTDWASLLLNSQISCSPRCLMVAITAIWLSRAAPSKIPPCHGISVVYS